MREARLKPEKVNRDFTKPTKSQIETIGIIICLEFFPCPPPLQYYIFCALSNDMLNITIGNKSMARIF